MRRKRFSRLGAGLLAVLMLLSVFVLPIGADGTTELKEQRIYYGVESYEPIGENLIDQVSQSGGDLVFYTYVMEPDAWYYVNITKCSSMNLTGHPNKNDPLDKFTKVIYVPVDSGFVFYTGTVKDDWSLLMSPKSSKGKVEGTIQKVKSFEAVYNAQYTTFEEDHKNLFPQIDLSKYDKATGDFIELITVYEDIEIADDYTWDGHVYLYLFNGTGKEIRGGTLSCPDDDGKESTFPLVPVRYSQGNFYKLEVTGHWWHKYKYNSDNSVNIHSRKRNITNLTIDFWGGTSKVYPYSGSFLIEDKVEDGKVTGTSVTGKFETQVNLDINYTYYRTDTSPNGAYYHNQVDSIYFNVPNYLKEAYGRLVDVKMSYQRARMAPIFVTDNYDLNNYLQFMIGKDLSTYNETLPSLYWIDSSYSTGIDFGLTCNNQLGDIGSFLYPYVLRSSRVVDKLALAFLVEDVDAGVRKPESTVWSENLVDRMYDYTEEFGSADSGYQGAKGTLSGALFSEVDDVTVVNVASLDLKADSYKKNHNFFQQWAEYGFLYANGGISTDITLDLSEKIVEIEKAWQLYGKSDVLYYAESDEKELQNCFRKSEVSDSTMYLVRFNVSQYYQHPLTVDMEGKTYNDIAYMAEQDIYLNLHVLELTYENEVGVQTVVPVSSNHIDAVGDVTTEKTPEQIDEQAKNEMMGRIGSFWDRILDKFKQIGKILALILGVVVVVLIVVFVVPVVSPIFRAVFGAIGRFFRGIGDKAKAASEKRKQRKNNRK